MGLMKLNATDELGANLGDRADGTRGKELDGPDEADDADCVLVAEPVYWTADTEGRELALCVADVLGAELNWWA